MHCPTFLQFGTFALSVVAAPTPGYNLHEKRTADPVHWEKGSRVDAEVLLPVRIGLTQTNLHKGPMLLDEVSTLGNPKYGKHYTAEEIHDLFKPSQESVDAVSEWLHSAGIHLDRISQSANKQWMQFTASASEVETLIQTEYHHYHHGATGKSIFGCDGYYVPEHITKHVDYITPGLKLLTPSPGKLDKRTSIGGNKRKKPTQGPIKKAMPMALNLLLDLVLEAICQVAIIPECITAMYNISKPTLAATGNQLGIFEDLNDMYSQTDLNEFFLTLAPHIPQGTHPKLDSIDGATAPTTVTKAGEESDLDFQISYPIIYPQNSILFQTDDDYYEANYTFQGFLNNFLDAIDGSYCSYAALGETGNSNLDPSYPDPNGYKGSLECGVYKPTNVISISYGGQEYDLPASYQQRQCNEFMKLGMQGVSVLVASGDYGVGAPAGDDSSDGCLGPGTVFSPDFPATCPYLTAVGATFLPPGSNVNKDQETAVTRFASGGGFSNIYPIPSYQASAVAKYFATSPPPYPYYSNSSSGNGGYYNRNGRGYPDVSAVGDNVVIFNMGEPTLIGGTSASSPTFAAILNRVNEERIAAGKSTVGFVNPALYANPGALHDITIGNNPGCGTNGFSTAKGWDPVTGLGTPDYPKLLKLFGV